MRRFLKRFICLGIGHSLKFYIDEHYNYCLRCTCCGRTKKLDPKGSLFE